MKAEPTSDKSVFSRLQYTFERAAGKIADTWREAEERYTSQEESTSWELTSLFQETLDFSLLKNDLKKIRQKTEQDESTLLGIYLTLYDAKDLMIIQVYRQKGDQTFVSKAEARVSQLKNFPNDTLDHLREKGSLKLHFDKNDISL